MTAGSFSMTTLGRLALRPRSDVLARLEGLLARTAPRLDRLDPPQAPLEEPRPSAPPRLTGHALPRADR